MFYFWWFLAAVLMLAELLIPGLIVVFVGLGAATVAALLYYHVVDGLAEQFLAWFSSSLIYCFSLRFLVLRFYKSDTEKKSTHKDEFIFGQVATVIEPILEKGMGRIYHAETTWKARSKDGTAIANNEKVKIVGRDNITWIVEKI